MRSDSLTRSGPRRRRVYWGSPHFLRHVTGKVVILTYHRVIPRAEVESSYVQPGMYVTPETFERHLQFLTAHFELLTVDACWRNGTPGGWNDAARYCAVTFDDGWIDNYRYAYPLLRRYGVPATTFWRPVDRIPDWFGRIASAICSAGAGAARRSEWDALSNARRRSPTRSGRTCSRPRRGAGRAGPGERRFVTWEEVAAMSRAGIAFGSHSSSHANLTSSERGGARARAREPLEILRARGVNHVPVLAYPTAIARRGRARRARRRYRAAVTVRPGLERSSRWIGSD